MKLAFSTLGCPHWDLDTIVQRAKEYRFHGIELRGYLDEMYIPRVPLFSNKAAETRQRLEDEGLEIPTVSSSASFTHENKDELDASVRETRDYIRCAHNLGVPMVRVFGGKVPEGKTVEDVLPQVVEQLAVLAENAAEHGVTLVIESHDDWTDSCDLRKILEGVNRRSLRALWDLNHPYRFKTEAPEDTMKWIGDYVAYVHCKDSFEPGFDEFHYCHMGEGSLPWQQMLDLLVEDRYDGYLTFEWEKRWHPDLPEPEVAFPIYSEVMSNYVL